MNEENNQKLLYSYYRLKDDECVLSLKTLTY